MRDAFNSERDLHQFLEKCIDAPDSLRFAIAHGISSNRAWTYRTPESG